jgi:hypothetical protein
VRRLGAYGDQLQPGRVADCYLAILLDQPLVEIAPSSAACWWSPRRVAARGDPQLDGPVLYELVTGHPGRAPRPARSPGPQ